MPVYTFECKKCKIIYDDLVPYDVKGKYLTVVCPSCNSKKKNKINGGSNVEVVFTDPRGTSKGDSFSYVAGFNMDQAKNSRRKAEKLSHMGEQPYPSYPD